MAKGKLRGLFRKSGSLRLAMVLPAMLVGLAALGSVSVGVIGYLNAQAGLERASRTELGVLAQSRKALLAERLNKLAGDLDNLTASTGAEVAVNDLPILFGQLSSEFPDVKAFFQPANSSVEARAELSGDGSKTMYGFQHAPIHASFASVWRNGGYGEIYVVDGAGNVVYTVTKSDDFLRSLSDAALSTSGLAESVAAAAKAGVGKTGVSAFGRYSYTGDAPALFVAQAVPASGAPDIAAGYVVIRLDSSFFNAVLGERGGLGETGQTYLVGADGRVLSDKPLAGAPTALVDSIADEAVIASAAEGHAAETRLVSGGSDVLATTAPLEFGGARWAVVAERSVAESLAAVDAMRSAMVVSTLLVVALATVVGMLFARSVVRPITRLTATMQALAKGDHGVSVEGAGKNNEIGLMARAVEVFRENAQKVVQLTDEGAARVAQETANRAAMMAELQRSFGAVVDAAVNGDFGMRVEARFSDPELNALAESVNNLVETVDRGLSETSVVLSAMARAELGQRVAGAYSGAFARLKDDTNAVADTLAEIVTQLQETSRALKVATSEILSGANDLSERTTRQAATVEETSAAMEQLSSTVLQNAERARDASSNAAEVTRTAEEGGAVMHEATQAMERITTSSAKISNIIGLIDDIAFQTNLLALNASVEAARAGEAGKGFAVVAVEVRRLAQSAAEASSEVKALIEQSGTEVRTGSKLVASAADRLAAMLEAARSNNALMESIARDSREQAAAIEEVNAAVRQLDEMTQHNSALVEETNAAIEQTEAQANELDRIVDVFSLAEAGAPGRDEVPMRAVA